MTPESGKHTLIFTIGHSTQALGECMSLLKAHGVRTVVDVRTVPRSRHNPQFNRDTLPGELKKEGIGYVHMKGLGGLRKSRPDSPNTGWRTEGFRGYADYMMTGEFAGELEGLLGLRRRRHLALMCAEAVPWRCHRSLISDALIARGLEVRHIMGETRAEPHRLTPFARVRGREITYPA